jgi:hypothetical protein
MESGDTVTAYSRVVFVSKTGETLSAFSMGDNHVSIPTEEFLGQVVDRLERSEGLLSLKLASGGTIRLERIGSEPEVALVSIQGTFDCII